jgi:hypothetical protein
VGNSKLKLLIQAGISSELIQAIITSASNLVMSEERKITDDQDTPYYMDKIDVKESFEFHCDHVAQTIIDALGVEGN